MESAEQNNKSNVLENESLETLRNTALEEVNQNTNSFCNTNLTESDDTVKNAVVGCKFESREAADKDSGDSENDRTGKLNVNLNDQVHHNKEMIQRPLCADYRSDSESDSIDSESDSSSSTLCTSSSNESEKWNGDPQHVKNDKISKKKINKSDLSLPDLPPIEELNISVSKGECVEIGTITSIVETLVIVESYKGSAALDVDTVLFLDYGKRTLGKIFDILGPVSEPVYTVRFNSNEQIAGLQIDKGMKVFYAPKTKHTSFVFISEIMKIRGSDASWKDNVEAPLEFQDFSDDEEERRFKNKVSRDIGDGEGFSECKNKSRKRPFPKPNHNSNLIQPSRFRAPENVFKPQNQRFPNTHNTFRPIQSSTPITSNAPYPGENFFTYYPSSAPHPSISVPPPYQYPPPPPRLPYFCFPPRFSGFPFPTFTTPPFMGQVPNFQRPFYQQRSHTYNGPSKDSVIQIQSPPPPPPPTS